MKIDTDLTFFTNDENQTLLQRFKATLADTQYFDVLVGYFRFSGFYQLCDSIAPIQKTRILVGIGVDRTTIRGVDSFRRNTSIDFETPKKTKEAFTKNLINDVENAEENDFNLERGLNKLIEFLKTRVPNFEEDVTKGGNGNQLEIRAFPTKNLHAKVYVGRFPEKDRDFGFVITGSSNFSYSGLVGNREFNVELRQRRDVEFALDQFEELWKQSIDISEDFVRAIKTKTWLNDSITPYELYLKLVYEYMQEDINLDDTIDIFLPPGFMALEYQKQAVQQAIKKLKEHNGVFLADVVGLGKTFITAQLLQQIKGRILVICPPVLKEYWEESLQDFRVPAKVESLGKLEKIIREGFERYDYIVVDEAHRFRNESTQQYADLLDICRGKKIILVTATPLNNRIEDIYAQLKLFQTPKKSTIPGIPDLEHFFVELRGSFKGIERDNPEYKNIITKVSKEIREKILKHVMVRRTRSDVMTYFKKDTETQNLFFPDLQDPRRFVYEFEGKIERVFNETMVLLKTFEYARYTPLLYYCGTKVLTEFERQTQRNVGGFMKMILVKRLESSFYAFRKSIGRFVKSYENFVNMFDKGTVYISKDVNVFELVDNDSIEQLEKLIEEGKAQQYDSKKDFTANFYEHLLKDLETLRAIQILWKDVHEDPKLETFVKRIGTDPILKNKQLVVFSESKETGEYLFDHINKIYPGEVMFFSSIGGKMGVNPSMHGKTIAREMITTAFDPTTRRKQNDNIKVLIATDVLAEGINLHRSNVLINYDLPWNPTRVLQRAGRINRLGSKHTKLYIYNFFPTTQSDEHLGLETNITNKIQMFHDILGEDAKYLTDGEEIGSQELFNTLNQKTIYLGDDEDVDSELKYLEMMRTLRDKDPDLFETIKKLPKKARSGRLIDENESKLITFFRIGSLKKFYIHEGGQSREITFFEAVNELECKPDAPRHVVPKDYFHGLEINKQRFQNDTIQPETSARRGSSNIGYIERRLKNKAVTQCKKFTDIDEDFIRDVLRMVQEGRVAKKTAQVIKKKFEKTLDPLDLLGILRKHIRTTDTSQSVGEETRNKKEIILSGYLVAPKDVKE